MNKSGLSNLLLLPGLAFFSSVTVQADDSIEDDENRIVVTAEFEEVSPLKLSSSVTVISKDQVERNNATHLSDLFNLTPNLNYATGASRGRFIQIRGVGERSEFVEPVNYSVGVLLDGIDMTGIVSGATMLDVQQVEVLRGPQGTLFGANALAGLINIVSEDPTEESFNKLNLAMRDYGGKSISYVHSGTSQNGLGYRLAIGQVLSDGFVENQFLGRDDTNNIDEQSFKAKFSYQSNSNFQLESNFLFIDVDNGYDAFSFNSDNITLSDQPGHDRQKTLAGSFIAQWQLEDSLLPGEQFEARLSFADSSLEYGYDEDWSHPGICDDTDCDSDDWGFDWWYSSFDNYLRENANASIDLRMSGGSENGSTPWTIGFYLRDQQVELIREYTFASEDFSNVYDTSYMALYGQRRDELSEDWRLISGLRLERQEADYVDNQPFQNSRQEDLWGGKLALEYAPDNGTLLYASVSRGYKAGGFNTSPVIPASDREYATEYMWNYEVGFKANWPKQQLNLQASLFYQDRKDIQSKQSFVVSQATGESLQEGGICPCNFIDYTVNASGANSKGGELELNWRANDYAQLYSTVGILKTEFKAYQSFTHVLADLISIPPVPYDLTGRGVAHAPEYQIMIGANFFLSDSWTLNSQVESKDEFYLSDRHQVKTNSVQQFHIALTYQKADWLASLFVRNINDEEFYTRGFGSFGNDPRNFYMSEPYFQLGSPREAGVKLEVEF